MKLSTAILMPVGAIGLAAALAACGSSSASEPAASTQAPAVTSSAAPAPGGSDAAGGSAGAPAPGSTADREAFRSCLAQHGITLPSREPGSFGQGGAPGGTGGAPGGSGGAPGAGQGLPGGGQGFPGSGNSKAFQDAMKACGGASGFGGMRPGAGGPNSGAFQAYRSCLSDHGVAMPTAGGPRPQLSTSDPKVAAALKTCAPLRPSFQGNPAPAAS